jgi:hypothetical protein
MIIIFLNVIKWIVLRLIMKTEFVFGEVWNDSLHLILMHIRFQRVNQGGIFFRIFLLFCQRAPLCIYFEYSADSLGFSVSNEVKNLPIRTNRKTTWRTTTRNWHLCTELRKQHKYQGFSNETSLLFVLRQGVEVVVSGLRQISLQRISSAGLSIGY